MKIGKPRHSKSLLEKVEKLKKLGIEAEVVKERKLTWRDIAEVQLELANSDRLFKSEQDIWQAKADLLNARLAKK